MKIVLQDGIKDCGICCLLSIIRYYKGEISKEYLRELTNTTKDGVSFYNLIEGAKKIGFEAIGLTGKLRDIDQSNLPCIAHIIVNKNYKHFIVIYEINENKKQIIVMDPAKGKRVMSFSEFNLLTSSNYIFLKPIKPLPIIHKKNIIFYLIKESVIKSKNMLLIIMILTLSFFILNIIVSFHFKYILDYAISFNISKNILFITKVMAICYLLKNITLYLRNILFLKISSIFDLETTNITYNQLLLLPYLYYKNRTVGEVISRFRDLETIKQFISNVFMCITTDILTIIIFFYVLFSYNKVFVIYLILPLILIIVYEILTSKYNKKLLSNISKGQDLINADIITGINNVDTVKGSHVEKRLIDKFSIHYKNFINTLYKYQNFLELSSFFKNNIHDTILIILYGLGSYYVIKSKLSFSILIIYQSFFSYYLTSFQNIIKMIEQYQEYYLARDRVEEIFMIEKEYFKNNYFYIPYNLLGDIKIHNLNYKVGNKKIFNDLELTIKKGEKILLSGDSGSGKSTLLKMLLRYIEVDYDNIKIAGIDINHYHLENIRSKITYITGDEYLFADTIKNNIILQKDIENEYFEKICKICFVDNILKKNINGYDSLIEEDGFNFSHGERQRIILARSILRDSNIYIFDEALSGIDINHEKKILNNIFEYLKDKTVIVISHRSHNKKIFDRVLKLRNGKIYEN